MAVLTCMYDTLPAEQRTALPDDENSTASLDWLQNAFLTAEDPFE